MKTRVFPALFWLLSAYSPSGIAVAATGSANASSASAPAAPSGAATTYPIVPYHPRVIINRDLNLPTLKARAFGALNTDYLRLASSYDPSLDFCGLDENVLVAVVYGTGYLYQISGNPIYADKLIDGFLLRCTIGTSLSSDAIPAFQVESAAIAFDWTYDRILARDKTAPGLKQNIINRIKTGYVSISEQGFFRDQIRESDFHNYVIPYEWAFLAAGLALYGEDPAALEMIQRGWGMIADGYSYDPTGFGEVFTYRLKSSIDLTGGAMNWEGSGYWRSAVPPALRAIEAFDTATNRVWNVWSTQFSNTINAGYYKLYTMRPDLTVPGLGDATAAKLSWKDHFGLVILMSRFQDGYIRQLIDTDGAGWSEGYGYGLCFKLMFYDPAVSARPFTGLPPSRQFGRDIVMRSGWGASDTFMTFSAGFGGVYHGHLDDNAFTIFKYGDLAADGGYALTAPYYQNYFKRTVAHNAITVYDPAECWRDNTSSCTLSNDGGQRWLLRRYSPPYSTSVYGINRLWSGTALNDPLYQEQFQTAKKTFEAAAAYDYIVSDATKAYSNSWSGLSVNTGNRVSKAIRQFVYLRGDYVVVLDRVGATNSSFEKSWLLHSVNPPQAQTGGTWTAAVAGIQDYAANNMKVDNGQGRLFIRTILPPAPRSRTIGGPGYEGWVNGQNYWATTVPAGTATWRFEIKPGTSQNDDLFLHVLYPTTTSTATMPPTTTLDSGAMTGALISDPAKPAIVLFSKTGVLQTAVSYTAAHSVTARHLIADLQPGRYSVMRNGVLVGTYAVAAGGALYFETVPGGTFRVSQVGTGANAAISMNSTPPGRSVTVDGVSCNTPCTFQWAQGSAHTLAAATQPGAVGIQYAFANWSDGGAATHTVVAPATDTVFTANFTTQYSLTTAASPAVGGSISPASGWVAAGTPVSVAATANTGYQFSGFSGGLTGATSPQSLTMNAPAAIIANFAVLSSGGSSPAWYSTGGTWRNRKPVTINHTRVAGVQPIAGFPVMVSITDASLAASAKPDGSDILFTAADGFTRLNHEIEQYVSTSGKLTAWVNIPSLSPTSDTVIYLYYGNAAAANQQNPAAVWDARFRGVWHFGQTGALSLADSTTGINVVAVGPVPAISTGKAGGAVILNGTNQALNAGNRSRLNVDGTFTIEAWVKPALTSGRYTVFSTAVGNAAGSWQLEIGSGANGSTNGAVALTAPGAVIADTAGGLVAANAWTHVAVRKSGPGDNAQIYVNGALVPLAHHISYSAVANTSDKYIGEGMSGQFFPGIIDEVRLSAGMRSTGWIQTEYNNQSAPGSFLTVGPQETLP